MTTNRMGRPPVELDTRQAAALKRAATARSRHRAAEAKAAELFDAANRAAAEAMAMGVPANQIAKATGASRSTAGRWIALGSQSDPS